MGFKIEIEIFEDGCAFKSKKSGNENTDMFGRVTAEILGNVMPTILEQAGKNLGWKTIAVPMQQDAIVPRDTNNSIN